MKKKIIIYSSILFIIDLISKLLIDNLLSFGENIYIIKNFLVIKKVYNTGASFSILLGKSYLFIICGIICIYYLYKSLNSINNNKLIIISYSLLFSGIIGNMVDRILYKHVIDFISILSFPIFNIADIFICSGSILLLIYYMKEGNL